MSLQFPPESVTHLHEGWAAPNVVDGFTVALVGDIIITQPIANVLRRQSPQLLDLLGGADLVIGNFEGTIVDAHTFDGSPSALSGFGWLNSPVEVAADLAEVGFDVMSRANNHSTDWGARGMLGTDEYLRAAGIKTAGTGRNLTTARAPEHHDGAQVRSSLVSFTTTFEADSPAIDAQGHANGRPGASTLGLTPVTLVSAEQFEVLREIRDGQPQESLAPVLIEIDTRLGIVTLGGHRYAPAPDGMEPVQTIYLTDQQDLAQIIRNVRQAKQTSDYTVVASHTHEPDNWTTRAPGFLRTVAGDAFANGADLFVSHGPHQLRGIEFLDGRPAFYSLGNFCFMDNAQPIVVREEWERRLWQLAPNRSELNPETTTSAEFLEWQRVEGVFAEDVWFESVIPLVTYRADGSVQRITLHPIELGAQGRDAERGIPRLAGPEQSVRILERLQALSEPLGTTIEIDTTTGVGTITPN